MRPDRVIIGEVRNKPEVAALFESLQAGQAKGCYATFHAQNSRETINRLIGMGIPKFDLSCIDLIIIIRRMTRMDIKTKERTEIRRIMEISEIDEFGKPLMLFDYSRIQGKIKLDREKLKHSKIIGKIGQNFDSSGEEVVEKICNMQSGDNFFTQ